MNIDVLLVDDYKMTIQGIAALLKNYSDINVVGVLHSGEEAVVFCKKNAPDVVVIDIKMSKLNGIDATQLIKEANNSINIIAITQFKEAGVIKRFFAVGGSGYLPKENSADELVTAIRHVSTGKRYLSPDVMDSFLDNNLPGINHTFVEKSLSKREIQILIEIARGFHTEAIAGRLKISPKTVAAHRRNIMKKLKIDNVVDLTKYAIRKGYISPHE